AAAAIVASACSKCPCQYSVTPARQRRTTAGNSSDGSTTCSSRSRAARRSPRLNACSPRSNHSRDPAPRCPTFLSQSSAPSPLPPGRGPLVQARHGRGFRGSQLMSQQLAEQVVVAEPPALPVERDEEQPALLEVRQHLGRVACPDHLVAERAAHPVQQGRVQQ